MVAAGTRRGEVTKLRKTTKYPLVLQAANDYLTDPSSSLLAPMPS
jgi:DNA helicase-2/ATP-dependent DNA helicase PcrA